MLSQRPACRLDTVHGAAHDIHHVERALSEKCICSGHEKNAYAVWKVMLEFSREYECRKRDDISDVYDAENCRGGYGRDQVFQDLLPMQTTAPFHACRASAPGIGPSPAPVLLRSNLYMKKKKCVRGAQQYCKGARADPARTGPRGNRTTAPRNARTAAWCGVVLRTLSAAANLPACIWAARRESRSAGSAYRSCAAGPCSWWIAESCSA